ncbi:MAG: DUF4321 domain-containing protein [Bacillota bacterium]
MVNNLGYSGKTTNWAILLLLLLMGFIFGTVIGEVLRPFVPILAKGAAAGLNTQTFHLGKTFSLTFGFHIQLNLATVIGVIIAFVIYRRL